jgi:hypothetical protein
LELYREICTSIRTTDEISFRLLGTVPVVATILSGALVVLEKTSLLGTMTSGAVLAFAVLGAILTTGLMIWELRNVRWCMWLINRAASFETRVLSGSGRIPARTLDLAVETGQKGRVFDGGATPTEVIQFAGWTAMRNRWGKREAEWFIYLAAIAVWLVPAAIALLRIGGMATK